MKAYNKRLDHTTELYAIDMLSKKVKLLQPNSNPKFYYDELLENITMLENTGVELEGHEIYVGDIVTDGENTYIVSKVPGGYFPFMHPVNKRFKAVINGM